MTTSTHDVDALKRMQRDAAKLRAERKRRSPIHASAAETHAEPDAAGEEELPESETDVQHYADQLAGAVKQFEDTAREHPALALLAVFTTGVVVGNLFSRR